MLSRLTAGLAVAALLAAAPLPAQQLPVQEHTLSNGLRVLLVERPGQATIGTAWAAHAGAANERPGATGLAHLLEHMIFKGTKAIGTRDAKRDAELNAAQDKVYAEIEKEYDLLRARQLRGEIPDMFDPKVRSERHQKLLAELEGLTKEQQELLVKGEFDTLYTEIGSLGTNAFTSNDVTCYILTVPANRLEFWCWMESDRLNTPVFREFYAERDVVNDERRLGEATPTGRFEEAFEAMVWQAHPYHWPVVGWGSDIALATRANLTDFFRRNYAPDNVTLALVGGFKASDVLPMLERYFGRIPARPGSAGRLVTLEPKQVAPQRMVAEAETTPAATVAWKTVALAHRDQAALDVLAHVLGGRSGRLTRALVLEQKISNQANATHNASKYGGTFTLNATAAQTGTPEAAEQALLAEVARVQKAGVTELELTKAKNQLLAGRLRQMDGNMELAIALATTDANAGNGYRALLEAPEGIRAVTREDVQRVAARYLVPEGSNTLIYHRPATAKESR